MSIKRYVEGKGWTSIASSGSSTTNNGKAVNISVADPENLLESENVEGALAELAVGVQNVTAELHEHKENHPTGGGGASMPTITSDFTITSSDGVSNINIPVFFTSPSLGEGSAYIIVNNVEVATQTIKQGNNEIIVPPIGSGKNIIISIYVKDRAGLLSNQLNWTVTSGGITMTLLTDMSSDYAVNDRIIAAYTITTVGNDDIFAHFSVDNVDNKISAKNGYNSYEFTNMSIGVHRVEYWAESGDYATTHKKFTLIVVDENTVLVSTDFDTSKDYESGVPISIPYRVSIDRNKDFTVNMYIDGKFNKSIITRPTSLYWTITSLDVGVHTLKIEAINDALDLYGSLEFTCNVVQSDYTRITPIVDASLLAWFDASEKTNNDSDRDIWTDKINGNIGKLYNFNYGSNGWIKQEGTTNSELVMNGTAYVEIDMAPFANNFKNGGVIEIVFKTRDVGNSAARILDITDIVAPYKGVYIDTREAYCFTSSQNMNASIGEDEYIHVMYNIDRINKYIHIVVNGVIVRSCKLSDTGSGTEAILESIAHSQKIYLNSQKGTDMFGSCEVKQVRIYDRNFTFDEMLQNYLSTFDDLLVQKAKSDFNDPLKNIMPIMNITVDPEKLATMTDVNKVEVAMTYTSPNSDLYGETITNASKCLMYWQGTSSLGYNVHNYNIELKDENRQDIMYSPYPDCLPQSLFCLKVNLMESTNGHNVGLADYVNKYLYTTKNPAQKENAKATRAIKGFPFLLYINGEAMGLYDFNLDRYSSTAYGYDLDKYKNTCRVYEVSANTNNTAGAFIPWTSATGVDEWTWYKNDFSGIYPVNIRNPVNDDFAALKTLISFVHDSTDEVFTANFSTYFDKESIIRYYIMVMVLGLVDSLGKNMKLVTFDGIKWEIQFYDMDTAMGLDNTGALKYDVDIEVNSDEFNTADSTLWSRVRLLFHDDIVNEYYNMRNNNLTVDKIYECLFTNQIEKIPEIQYNRSTQKKYLDTGEYIMMSNGNRYYNLKRWIKERLLYCDTLFSYSPTTARYITLRSGVEGSCYLDIQTYSPMYVTIEWRNQADGSGRQTLKVGRNETIRFNGMVQAKDQEVMIYGAEYLKDIGRMDGMMPRHLLLNNAYRLTSVECPGNTELLSIQINNCTYLQKVNLNGCSKLGVLSSSQVLDVSGCNNLRHLDAYGTIITSINTNQQGGNLVELYVPKTLQTLSLKNQYSLKVVGIPGANAFENTKVYDLQTNASNISSFSLINCPLVERLTYDDFFTVSSIFFDNYGNERSSSEINYLLYDKDKWKFLMACGNGLANADTIYIENSCYNMTHMSFRGISKLQNLTLRAMPKLKTLLLGANCCGYRSAADSSYDTYAELNWDNFNIIDCPAIEEFRIHEMYPNGYNEGKTGNLTYFTFAPGTDSIDLSTKFPNLKLFECNCPTQNIHQIILPQSLESFNTSSWHDRHDEGFAHEVKLDYFNIDSIYFTGEHDVSYQGVDFGNHAMKNVRVIAPSAGEIIGLNIVNQYVNPVFNTFKSAEDDMRPIVTPQGIIDVSTFKWKEISDWFAYIDFTKGKCQVIVPENWDTFLAGISKATRIFYKCINPEFTWEFAMKFFSKISSFTDFTSMYRFAKLAEQIDYDTDGVVMHNTRAIGGYHYNNYPFEGTNLRYIKSFTLTATNGAYATFQNCSSLIKIGDCSFTGSRDTGWGIKNLFTNCIELEEIGSITSSATIESGKSISMDNAFERCSKLKKIGAINIAANSINYTYGDCIVLTTEGLSLPNMEKTKDVRDAFRNCRSLTELPFVTLESVTQADSVCRGCVGLTTIHLPKIDRSSPLQDISNGFYGCSNLTAITLDEGATLPIGLRAMNYIYCKCVKLTNVIPIPTDFSYDISMIGCCSECHSLTDDAIYKEIPFRVIDITALYEYCEGLVNPVTNINSDHIIARQMFRYCPNIVTLTVNFNGRLLRDSTYFAEYCNNLTTFNMKFPKSFLMNEYYGTGMTYYNMLQYCLNLSVVNLDMSSLVNTNTKADLGAMFFEDKYIKEIHGLDLTYLKKPIREINSNQGTFDWHDNSITYGANYENLTALDITGLLNCSYDFKNITSLAHTKIILQHLDTVTSETLGLTYNVMDAIDDQKTEYVDPELKELAIAAINKGWTFAIV